VGSGAEFDGGVGSAVNPSGPSAVAVEGGGFVPGVLVGGGGPNRVKKMVRNTPITTRVKAVGTDLMVLLIN